MNRINDWQKKYPNIQEQLNYQDLNHLIRFRDYISHHYEQIESEVIRDICEHKLPVLKVKTEELITNLSKV